MKSQRGKKKRNKKEHHLVLTNRRCCALLRLYNACLLWGLEKWTPGAFYCFHISQGRRSLFPTAAASCAPFRLELRKGRKENGADIQEIILIIVVLPQTQGAWEGAAHREGRFPPTQGSSGRWEIAQGCSGKGREALKRSCSGCGARGWHWGSSLHTRGVWACPHGCSLPWWATLAHSSCSNASQNPRGG